MSAKASAWATVQRRAPGLAARVRKARAARAAGRPPSLEARVQRLEQDLELIAAQLAALTAQVARGTGPSDDADAVEARVNAARLGALAFYEERISRLEEASAQRRDHLAGE